MVVGVVDGTEKLGCVVRVRVPMENGVVTLLANRDTDAELSLGKLYMMVSGCESLFLSGTVSVRVEGVDDSSVRASRKSVRSCSIDCRCWRAPCC